MMSHSKMTKAFALAFLILLTQSGAQAATSTPQGATPNPQVCGAFAQVVGTPSPIFLTSCDTWVDCVCASGGDYLISCSGTSYCHHGISGGGWVECDGERTFCPPKTSC